MDVHVVCAENRHLYEAELDQHHRLRRDIYIGELGWRALTDDNGRERDQFDYPEAVYLLGIEPGVGVVSGSRLLPSWRPTLMSEVFPAVADVRGMPHGLDVYEWTRIFVAKSRREEHRLARAGGVVMSAMLEWGLQEGVRTIRCVAEAWWMPRLLGLGWIIQPLGLPLQHDGMTLAGFSFSVDDETLAATREFYGITRSCLVRRGLRRGQPLEAPHGIHG